MMELFLVTTNELIEIPAESITWSGQRYNAARKIQANILYSDKVGHQYTAVEEGNTILFRWNGLELFRGTVFDRSRTKSGLLSLTAYDMLQYLLINKEVYVFEGRTAADISKRICQDFLIPYNVIQDTSVRLDLIFQNDTTLYDIILKALVNTEKKSGRRFKVFSDKGALNVKEVLPSSEQWVLETGVNIIDYNFSTSIEGTATRVKLVAGEEDNPITVTVTDSDGQKKYGVLQYFEKVIDSVDKSELISRANTIISQKKGVKKTFEIDALGIPEIISNTAIYVIENDLGIKGTYYVDTDTHYFKGERHDMKLKLLEENTLPEVSA